MERMNKIPTTGALNPEIAEEVKNVADTNIGTSRWDPLEVKVPETFFQKTTKNMLDLSRKKNSDYANSEDSFANFRMCELMGISALNGCLVRLGDKVSRLASFQRKGEYSVEDESFADTCIDAANYSLIALSIKNDAPDITTEIEDLQRSEQSYQNLKDGVLKIAQNSGQKPYEVALGLLLSSYILLCEDKKMRTDTEHLSSHLVSKLALAAILTLELYMIGD